MAASHDRASEIAKELARAIEGFEERLVTIESNVHKEILSLKAIAESIQRSPTKTVPSASQQLAPELDLRLRGLEESIAVIISRLNIPPIKSK